MGEVKLKTFKTETLETLDEGREWCEHNKNLYQNLLLQKNIDSN